MRCENDCHTTDTKPPLSGVKLTSVPSQAEKQVVFTDRNGRVFANAEQRMMRSLPGNTCYSTVVAAEMTGFKSATVELGICGGDLVVSQPSPRRDLRIMLTKHADVQTSAVFVRDTTWDTRVRNVPDAKS
jgi:hypothetical protein